MRRLPSYRANVNDLLFLRDVVEHSVFANPQLPNWRNGLEWRNEVYELLTVACFDRRFLGKHFLDSFENQRAVICPDSLQVVSHSLSEANTIHVYIIAYALHMRRAR